MSEVTPAEEALAEVLAALGIAYKRRRGRPRNGFTRSAEIAEGMIAIEHEAGCSFTESAAHYAVAHGLDAHHCLLAAARYWRWSGTQEELRFPVEENAYEKDNVSTEGSVVNRLEIACEINGPSLETSWPTGFAERMAADIRTAKTAAENAVREAYRGMLPAARAADDSAATTWAKGWAKLEASLVGDRKARGSGEAMTNAERQRAWRRRKREANEARRAEWAAADAERLAALPEAEREKLLRRRARDEDRRAHDRAKYARGAEMRAAKRAAQKRWEERLTEAGRRTAAAMEARLAGEQEGGA